MKKLKSLTIGLILLTIMSFSCSKDDTPSETAVITVNDMVGNIWNCSSLDYNGTTYSTVNQFDNLNLTKDFVTINFKFNANLTVILSSGYTGTNSHTPWESTPFSFTFSNKVIDVDDGYLKFELINLTKSSTIGNSVMKLKLTKGNADMPIGGTYTLTR
jgi:hypothetical protein